MPVLRKHYNGSRSWRILSCQPRPAAVPLTAGAAPPSHPVDLLPDSLRLGRPNLLWPAGRLDHAAQHSSEAAGPSAHSNHAGGPPLTAGASAHSKEAAGPSAHSRSRAPRWRRACTCRPGHASTPHAGPLITAVLPDATVPGRQRLCKPLRRCAPESWRECSRATREGLEAHPHAHWQGHLPQCPLLIVPPHPRPHLLPLQADS